MQKIVIEVELGKETHDVTSGICGFISDIKTAVANGYQPGDDFPAILMSAVNNLIPAVEGMSKVDDEIAENKKSFIHAMGLMAGDLYEVLTLKVEVPELPAEPEPPANPEVPPAS